MRLSFAKWEPVARMNDGARDTKYNAVLLHTNGGKLGAGGDLYDWWMHGSSPGVGAHFQVAWDGTIYQYLDTARYTGHAWDANHWSVGVETQDDGVPSKPWTDAQIASIVLICQALKVPAKLLDCPGPGDGVGWHEKCPTWNQSHHVCPGSVREAQIRNVIIPKLAQPQEDDMVDPNDAAMLTGLRLALSKVAGASPKVPADDATGVDGHTRDAYSFFVQLAKSENITKLVPAPR